MSLGAGIVRVIALVADPVQVITQTESVNNLCRAGKKRANSHLSGTQVSGIQVSGKKNAFSNQHVG
jgi:hypothetical protein